MGSRKVGSEVHGRRVGDWTAGLRFRVRGGRPEIKSHPLGDWAAGLRFRAAGGLVRTPGLAELERPCQK